MAVEITHVRLSGATQDHESITHYRWRNDSNAKVGESTKPTMVEWIEEKDGRAYMGSGSSRANVGVIKPQGRQAYLRTYADGNWTNNLLALPRF